MVETVNGNGGGFVAESPYRWSRRWCQEPPVGTEVLLGGGWSRCMSGAGSGRRSRSELVAIRPGACPREERLRTGASGIGSPNSSGLGPTPRLPGVYPVQEGAGTRRRIRVVRGISGAMVEVRDDQPGTAGCPATGVRTVGRTCPGCCCPTSDYPRSDQRRQESHYKPHATPPFRSANRPIRSAAEPDFRMPAVGVKKHLIGG